MKDVKIEGLSKKGKQRVKELGSNWHIVEIRDKVQFSTLEGPWLLINPNNQKFTDKFSRWVNLKNDTDFKVEIM